jgi:hypothetical protein
MSEIDELRQEMAALRAELAEWKAIVVGQEGKIGRALGVAEGVGETQGLLNKGFDARLSCLEGKVMPQPIPLGTVQVVVPEIKYAGWPVNDFCTSSVRAGTE